MRPMEAAHDASGRSLADDAALPGLVTILNEFDRQKISYCYWKSSRCLAAVFSGEGDVDLLIARADRHRTQAILLARGFKLFPAVAAHDHPALLSFLGYDEWSGQLIHVHLHFRLIVGERLLQNYRIPWEEVLLARAIPYQPLPIKILDPASEAVLLVVRACLELRRQDPMTFRRWRETTRKFERDRRELAARVDRDALRRLASELLNEGLAESVVDAIYGGQPLERHARLCRRMRRHCAAYRSYSTVEMRVRSAARAALWIAGNLNKRFLHAPRPWNRRGPGGGCVVAIMGVDGSGKSTLAAAMRTWLGSKIDVVPIYFGTGDGRPSLLFCPFKLVLPLVMRLLKNKSRVASHGKISGPAPGLLYSVLLIFWAVAVALDKRKKLTMASRGAARGLIVLTDRYPQDQIPRFNDGPLLARLTFVPRWLRQLEDAVYARARRLAPDLVIKLVATPETIARRELAMDPALIRERTAALLHLKFPGSHVICVDAEQPLLEVIRAVKHEIWRLL
jgi:hypothetical protein